MIIYAQPKYRKIFISIGIGLGSVLLAAILYSMSQNREQMPKIKPNIPVAAPLATTLTVEKPVELATAIATQVPATRRSLVPDLKACERYNVTSSKTGSEDISVALQDERRRISAELAKQDGEIERGAGMYFLIRSHSYINYKDCSTENCGAAAEERFRSENEQAIGQLTKLASSTNSSNVYSWALNACSSERIRYDASNSCATLSRQKMVALDQDNGWGWLSLAAEANGKGNVSEVDEALFRAANSSRWVLPAANLIKLLIERIDQESDPLVILGILNDIKSISTEMSLSGLNTMASLCPAKADQNRAQICQKLAINVLNSTPDLIGLSIGLRVAERTGASSEKLIDKREEYIKVQSLRPGNSMMGTSNSYTGCQNAISVIKFLESSVMKGEIFALQEITREKIK